MNKFPVTINIVTKGNIGWWYTEGSTKNKEYVLGQFDWMSRDISICSHLVGKRKLSHVLLHEVYHSFGLGHCKNKSCVMSTPVPIPMSFELCKSCHNKFNKITTGKLIPELPMEKGLDKYNYRLMSLPEKIKHKLGGLIKCH